MSDVSGERRSFEIDRGGLVLRGDQQGSGQPVVLCHGLSATRDLVVHNSRTLPRSGRRVILWDARGHGESDPAPEGEGYGYPAQIGDLGAVIEGTVGDRPVVLGGHSMGCHTAAGWALAHPGRVAGLVLIGPVFTGAGEATEPGRWDERAKALEEGGPEAFARVAGSEFSGSADGRELIERLALRRAERHLHPEAVAEALRQVPRSEPFPGLESLAGLDVPTLVVGSRDDLDSGHPLEVARLWAKTIPGSEFVVEEEGDSPLAWQGGRLSRVIDSFIERAVGTQRDGDAQS